MLKSYKTEIDPSPKQKHIIHRTIGICRFIYNFYIIQNKKKYEEDGIFLTACDFSKWLNNEFLPNNPDYKWIKEVSSKAVKQSIINGEKAFKIFFTGVANFPKLKKKKKSDVKMYFVRNGKNQIIDCERHRIKIPTLGWIKIKEKGYLPVVTSGILIKSGHVSMKAGRYYVSVLVDVPEKEKETLNSFGIGIDIGLKDQAILSDKRVYHNINKTSKVRKIEKRLKREQRCLARKYENCKKFAEKSGLEYDWKNFNKQKLKVQKLYQKLDNIRTDYINKIISEVVKTKPLYVVIEDLNVSGMMKNRNLAKAVAAQKFFEFRTKLIAKCHECGIEVRIVSQWYPSSKRCHECGNIKTDLKLSDRTYVCQCGYSADRDYNASLNLRDATEYLVA